MGVAAAGAGAGLAPTGSPSIANSAMGWPTRTTSPSETNFLTKTPSSGAGTSESTLSVAISINGSSAETRWPSSTDHLMMVASATLSPIFGRRISMDVLPGGGLMNSSKGTQQHTSKTPSTSIHPQVHQQLQIAHPTKIRSMSQIQPPGLFAARSAVTVPANSAPLAKSGSRSDPSHPPWKPIQVMRP